MERHWLSTDCKADGTGVGLQGSRMCIFLQLFWGIFKVSLQSPGDQGWGKACLQLEHFSASGVSYAEEEEPGLQSAQVVLLWGLVR